MMRVIIIEIMMISFIRLAILSQDQVNLNKYLKALGEFIIIYYERLIPSIFMIDKIVEPNQSQLTYASLWMS